MVKSRRVDTSFSMDYDYRRMRERSVSRRGVRGAGGGKTILLWFGEGLDNGGYVGGACLRYRTRQYVLGLGELEFLCYVIWPMVRIGCCCSWQSVERTRHLCSRPW